MVGNSWLFFAGFESKMMDITDFLNKLSHGKKHLTKLWIPEPGWFFLVTGSMGFGQVAYFLGSE